jgi:cellulose biosynthesis protein BcsQ
MSATDFIEPVGFGSDPEPLTVYDVVAAPQAGSYHAAVRPSAWSKFARVEENGGILDVLPGDVAFRDLHIAEQGIDALARALTGAEQRYDLVILDCPPSTGPVVQAALYASADVLMVTEAKEASLNSFVRFIAFLNEISDTFQRDMNVSGILVTRHRTKEIEHRRKLQIFKEHYPNALIPVRIPERAAVAKADEKHYPVAELSRHEAGAQIVSVAYAYVAKHLLESLHEDSHMLQNRLDRYIGASQTDYEMNSFEHIA